MKIILLLSLLMPLSSQSETVVDCLSQVLAKDKVSYANDFKTMIFTLPLKERIFFGHKKNSLKIWEKTAGVLSIEIESNLGKKVRRTMIFDRERSKSVFYENSNSLTCLLKKKRSTQMFDMVKLDPK